MLSTDGEGVDDIPGMLSTVDEDVDNLPMLSTADEGVDDIPGIKPSTADEGVDDIPRVLSTAVEGVDDKPGMLSTADEGTGYAGVDDIIDIYTWHAIYTADEGRCGWHTWYAIYYC